MTVEYDDAKTKPQECCRTLHDTRAPRHSCPHMRICLQDMWDKMKKWADAAQKELAPCPA